MNEPVVPVAPVAVESEIQAQGEPSAVRAGQLLRQAREAVGLHVAALAVSLKVPVGKLEALEAGRLDALPDVMFARALAASVCRSLKIDAAPVLAHFPQGAASRLGAADSGINTPFRQPHTGPRFGLKGQMPSPSVVAVALLLVAALAVFLWPKSKEEAADVSQGADVSTAVPAPTPVVEPLADPAPAASAVLPAPLVAAPAAPVAPAPVVVPAASAPLAAAIAPSIMVVTATGESWLKVTDAKGVVAFSRTLNAGEVVQPSGTPPFTMVVGRVDAVQLNVRGQAFDMTPFAKDHVARFEVK
ncbi:MAG: helix-turn-helix domain-containing protein [Burkholderiales bacterium]|nr:helix-turn-helix domain-containing protein [Burkholderiales bacterium]